ncbi:MAG: hypothetical protein ACK5LJ_17765 [Paracoccus sp. (in: a-proteobacteria)]
MTKEQFAYWYIEYRDDNLSLDEINDSFYEVEYETIKDQEMWFDEDLKKKQKILDVLREELFKGAKLPYLIFVTEW